VDLWSFEFDLDQIRDYIQFFEDHLASRQKDLDQQWEEFQREKDQLSEEEQNNRGLDAYQDHLIDEAWSHERNFVQYFRQSQVIQIYSFLERALRVVCNMYARQLEPTKPLSVFKGNGEMERVKTFLKEAAGIDINYLNPEWRFIDGFRKLRNRVAHNHSKIGVSHPHLNHIRTLPAEGLKLKQISQNVIDITFPTSDFLLLSIEQIRQLLRKIDNYAD